MNAVRKRLPAYGAQLRDSIRAGALPLCVHLVYGFAWKAETACCYDAIDALTPRPHPLIAMKPTDYVPGTLDFSVLTGLKVCVFDQDGRIGDALERNYDRITPEAKALYALAGELAQFAAEVEIYSPAFTNPWSAHEITAYHSRGGWPFWWSDDIEKKHGERRARWYDAFYRIATARAA